MAVCATRYSIAEKGKKMLEYVLFVMIGLKLNMSKWFWYVTDIYLVLWIIGKVVVWLG